MGKWRKKGIVISLVLSCILLSSFGNVSATIITAHTVTNWVYPAVSLDVAYDTVTTRMSISWDGSVAIAFPFPSVFTTYLSSWKVKDELGFVEEKVGINYEGSVEIYYYNRQGTWVTVRVIWTYSGGFWFFIPECKVKMWIPHTPALWDINEDAIINMLDVAIMQQAFGSTPSSPNWNPDCDLNFDNIIDMLDVAFVSYHYGETY